MTIAEIAARAGVSKTAVSRYLNNGYISEEKKEAIRRVIEETGYVPSRQAQTLRTGRSRMIGVVLPRIDSESISRIVAGISRELTASGFQLLLANTENDENRELEYLEVFRNGHVDGILLIATMMTPAHRRAITESPVPIVVIGQQVRGASCVFHDDRAAACTLTERLLGQGRRKPGYIGVTLRDKAAGLARRQGFLDALEAAGVAIDPLCEEVCGFDLADGTEACVRMLARGADFDALFCATDSIAIGAMQALETAGRRVPEEVAVVGIGHSRLSGLVRPTLTTAHYYYETSGQEAARILLDRIEGGADLHKQLQLGFEIIERQTTGEKA